MDPYYEDTVDGYSNRFQLAKWHMTDRRGSFDRNRKNSNEECRARSDCTYVQTDLALHYP